MELFDGVMTSPFATGYWVLFLILLLVLLFRRSRLWTASIVLAGLVISLPLPFWVELSFLIVLGVLNIPPIRQRLFSNPLMSLMNRAGFLPTISQTEQTAIEAGNVWIEGELFGGKPDPVRLMETPWPELSKKERAFLDGPVEEICNKVSDWAVFQERGLPEEVWDQFQRDCFFGLIIPEEYGGHGFSHTAHSTIIAKLASRSGPLATTVMVPNSLGPAELILHYGTDRQKEYYLPRLARGEEIPCFALTEPGAGSDAGAMQSTGTLYRSEDGSIGIRLKWEKRYITLASISTVMGLAFKLRDPDHLLGDREELGITCALVRSDLEGVILGKRHDPLGVPFHNCPTRGNGVEISLEDVIGGEAGVGKGWQMLMESLAVGRGISLPAQAAGSSKVAYRAIGAYTVIRTQFGLPIGLFEGIEEPMARIGGFNYIMEAVRRQTCAGLDFGAKPAVVTAISKYQMTEMGRVIVNDAMDIVGGAGISRGPRNLFSSTYMATPIGITVEGANILTRTLMIFGQGAIRCHPFIYKEIEALMSGDQAEFDRHFWSHVGHTISNGVRAGLLSLTRGALAASPNGDPASGYWKKLGWASASFAFFADLALVSYGGALKRKEKIAGRYADILSWLYMATAVLRRYKEEGFQEVDKPFVEWSLEYAFWKIDTAFDELFQELAPPGLGWILHYPVSIWSRFNRLGKRPSDYLGQQVARAMQEPGEQRDRFSEGIVPPGGPEEAMGRLEHAFRKISETEPLRKRLREAVKSGTISGDSLEEQLESGIQSDLLSMEEAGEVREAEAARWDAIQVDEFTLEEYQENR
ncbi:MAG: acyl-CoA dehydrogenase [Balneolaceae bacterium]